MSSPASGASHRPKKDGPRSSPATQRRSFGPESSPEKSLPLARSARQARPSRTEVQEAAAKRPPKDPSYSPRRQSQPSLRSRRTRSQAPLERRDLSPKASYPAHSAPYQPTPTQENESVSRSPGGQRRQPTGTDRSRPAFLHTQERKASRPSHSPKKPRRPYSKAHLEEGGPHQQSFSHPRREVQSPPPPRQKPVAPPPLGPIRLVRFLALAGVSSRRRAADIIKNSQVAVNGETVREPWRYVDPEKDQVTYKGQRILPEKPVYILLNKPKDTLCTVKDMEGRRTVLDLLEGAPPVRLYPVGRLDRNTTGILLLTNDGDLAEKLLHPRSKVPRTYRVTTVKPMNSEVVERLLRGIALPDGAACADEAHLEDPYTLILTLHIGKKHIVRRMMEHLGYRVKGLDRIAFGPITRKGVPRGQWRYLTPQEVAWLKMLPSPDAHPNR